MTDFISVETRGNVTTTWLWNYGIHDPLPRPEQEEYLRRDILMTILASDGPIGVIGHASRSGTESHNLELSRKRADAVADIIMSLGIDPNRINPIAFGESKHAPDGTEDDKDRGVRIITISAISDAPKPETLYPVSLPRPSNAEMYRLIEREPVASQIHMQEMIWVYMPDLLNVMGPTSGGVSPMVDVGTSGYGLKGLLESKRPNDPERFAEDENTVLDRVWERFSYQLETEGLAWSEDYVIIHNDGQPVRDPFH